MADESVSHTKPNHTDPSPVSIAERAVGNPGEELPSSAVAGNSETGHAAGSHAVDRSKFVTDADRRRRRLAVGAVGVGWAIYVGFVVVSVLSSLFAGKVFAATDMLLRAPTYWDVAPVPEVTNVVSGDTVDSVIPRSIDFEERLHQGDFPEWNPYMVGGEEFAGLPNTGLMSPLSLPWWIAPPEIAPALVKLLEFAVVALGMSLFLRRLKLPAVTWPLASLAYCSSGFMIAWTNWPQTRVAALIPLAFWAVDYAVTRRKWFTFWPLALAFAAMWLGGFPAVVFHTAYLTCAYGVVRAITQTQWHKPGAIWQFGGDALRYLGGMISAGALAAVALLPFYLNSKDVLDFSVRDYRGSSLNPEAFGTAILPYAVGTAGMKNFTGPFNPVEALSYLGVVVVLCALLALAFHRRLQVSRAPMWFFVIAAALIGMAMYWGGPVLDVIQQLPTMSTSLIGRLRAVFGFCVAVLAAFGVTALMSDRISVQVMRTTTRTGSRAAAARNVLRDLVGWAFVAMFAVLVLQAASVAQEGSKLPDWSARWIKFSAVFAAVALVMVALILLVRQRWFQNLVVVGLIAVLAVPSLLVVRAWWPHSKPESYYAPTEAFTYLQENLGEDRYLALGGALPMGASTVYKTRDVLGHAFMTGRWKDMLGRVYPNVLVTPTYPSIPADQLEGVLDSRILDRLAVRYLAVGSVASVPGRLERLSTSDSSVDLRAGSVIRSGEFTGPIRGIQITALDSKLPEGTVAPLKARIVGQAGDVLAETRILPREIGEETFIPFDGDELSADKFWHLELETEEQPGTVTFGADSAGNLAVAALRPVPDGINVAQAGNVTLLERASALERVRWANDAVVEKKPAARIDLLAGDLSPNTVVLEQEPVNAVSPGSTATVEVLPTDDLDRSTIRVSSTGAGWVVVADSLDRSGWTATIDGQQAELLRADHVGGAVYVPGAGEHTITLEYRTPGLRVGILISGLTLAGVLGLVVLDFRARRRSVEEVVTDDRQRPSGSSAV